jgi:general secretion pathway protein J
MRAQRGFTLVELLVALFAMAILSTLAWRGLDGMTRAQAITETRSDEVLALQTGLAQWTADLDAMEQVAPGIKAIEWNGRVLRITRRSTVQVTDGVLVVGWTRRIIGDRAMWLRWQSAPVTTRADIETAWQDADLWSQNQGGEAAASREVVVAPLADWQVFFYRDNAWTNPQSSGISIFSGVAPGAPGAAGALAASTPPDGVRLVLTLPPEFAVSGVITRDWVQPQLTP